MFRFKLPRFGGLARSTFIVLCWSMARLGLQLLWVILLARFLGVAGYGAFSGAAGLAIAFSGFAGAGLGLRLYQDVSRAPGLLGVRWAQAVRMQAITSLLLALLFLLAGAVWLPDIAWPALLCITIAELLCMPVVSFVAFAYGSQGQMGRVAAAPVLMSLARIMAILAMLLSGQAISVTAYAGWHAAAAILAAGWLLYRCRKQLRPPPDSAKIGLADFKEGMRLSSIWASSLALGAVDKAAALRFAGADAAGNYTASQRFASLLAAPVDALVTAVMPRLFRHGAGQIDNPRLIGLLALCVAAYGCLSGGVLWLGADGLPWILGADFAAAVPALQVMAFYLPAYCLRILGANILLGYGQVLWRFGYELLALLVLLILMLAWAGNRAAVGAAWALVVTESLLAALLWGRLLLDRRRGGKNEFGMVASNTRA